MNIMQEILKESDKLMKQKRFSMYPMNRFSRIEIKAIILLTEKRKPDFANQIEKMLMPHKSKRTKEYHFYFKKTRLFSVLQELGYL